MAWGRKKSSGRKEPLFGLPAALSELRLSPQDRIPSPADEKPKKAPNRKSAGCDDEAPRERKLRETKSGSKRRAKCRSRSDLYRLVFLSSVLGLWGLMSPDGVV